MSSKMTRKHFRAIAEALRESHPGFEVSHEANVQLRQWRCTVVCIAKVCASFNPAFDRGRFVDACIPEEAKDED